MREVTERYREGFEHIKAGVDILRARCAELELALTKVEDFLVNDCIPDTPCGKEYDETVELIENTLRRGSKLGELFQALLTYHKIVGDVRGKSRTWQAVEALRNECGL